MVTPAWVSLVVAAKLPLCNWPEMQLVSRPVKACIGRGQSGWLGEGGALTHSAAVYQPFLLPWHIIRHHARVKHLLHLLPEAPFVATIF